jgi:hypothetical protein
VNAAIAALNKCRYLFLQEIQELDWNGLRLVVSEGLPAGESGPIHVGDAVIGGGTRIDVKEESRVFELVWSQYVAYGVLNESYANVDDPETFEGSAFRVYSKSHFMNYVSRASFASAEYPGPMRHQAIVCSHHVIDVVSVELPTVKQLGP